jgi:dTDP-4-dehydrorhamnose reductase
LEALADETGLIMRKKTYRITIIGKETLLGSDVFKVCSESEDYDVQGLDSDAFDLDNWKEFQLRLPSNSTVINCLDYGDVEWAEENAKAYFKRAIDTVRFIANACTFRESRLFHFSSHHVFDGLKGKHYTERDVCHPVSVYGKGCLAGEKTVRAEGGNTLILRVQSLFGLHGPNYAKLVVDQLNGGITTIRAIGDLVTAPTYTKHVAEAVSVLIKMDRSGLLNIASSGECSQYAFAKAIVKRVNPLARVEMVSMDDLGYKAHRPKYGVLSNYWLESWTGKGMPDWESALDEFLTELGH